MDDIELIKQKINIVDLIQEYIPLKKAGVNYKANCPFHNEKTPSFMVSAERGIWKCFGCQKSGDIFQFLMEKESIDFKEALDILAKKAGVTLSNKPKTSDTKDRLFQVNLKAQQFFHHLLIKHSIGENALIYLQKRGINKESIEEFGLGYAPQNWEALTKFLKKRQFTETEMINSGLCIPSKRGCYDRFRGRITFPLTDTRGNIVGFAGRVLDKSEPKYLNTPQTSIFDKSKNLFGLNLSKDAIREKKEAILVEGELDVIMSYQTNIKNVVASKGTALTESQLELLKKYTNTIILCFDQDTAGDAASQRGIELAEKHNFNLKVIKMEGGKDPAEICLKNPKHWSEIVTESISIYDFFLDSVSHRYNSKDSFGKKAILSEILPIWTKIADSMIKEHYIQKLAALLQVKEEIIRSEMKKYQSSTLNAIKSIKELDQSKLDDSSDQIFIKNRRELLEEYLIALILHIPEDYTFIPNFPETLFTQDYMRQIYVLLVIYLDAISFKGKSFKISEFIKSIPSELVEKIDHLYLIDLDDKLTQSKLWQKELDLTISELKKMLIKSSLEKLTLEIKNAQSFDKIETLTLLNKKFRDLSIKLKNI